MSIWTAAVLAISISTIPAVVEKDGVRIEASIKAHVYTWTITNVDAPPIMGFTCEPKNTYNNHTPAGWSIDEDGDQYSAGAEHPRHAIQPGRAGVFDARVSSSGAVLGSIQATVSFGPDHEPVVFDEVWGPVAKPRANIALLIGVIVAIGVLHTAWTAWRHHARSSKPPISV